MKNEGTLDLFDGRILALVIARTYACGYLELGSVGSTWVPRDPRRGSRWTPRRCEAVLRQLVAFGYCSLHEGATGPVVRVTEIGYRALDIHGVPAISDADAERRVGPRVDDRLTERRPIC